MLCIIKNIVNSIWIKFRPYWVTIRPYFYRTYANYKIKDIRNKKKIRVLFIVAELGSWKTELLYKAMLIHPRFEPIIGITESIEVPGSKVELEHYIRTKGYEYVDLDSSKKSIKSLNVDIKFYYKPYLGSYRKGIYFDSNWDSLVCHINYAFNVGGDFASYNREIIKCSYMNFIENAEVLNTMRSIPKLYIKNIALTGVPMQDLLLLSPANFSDPWKKLKNHKRVIYAPHHSIPGTNGSYIEYSTFLIFGEYILQLAQKYKDSVQWAFKPHPTLYPKLLKIWGKDRTDNYYNSWRNLENTQVALGEYVGLFKYSDAMIHDCSSFVIEYLFVQKPVMFLQVDSKQTDIHQGKFSKEALKVHVLGHSERDIENFIINVINGVDEMCSKRKNYFQEYLLPPNNRTACDNIISALLGNY